MRKSILFIAALSPLAIVAGLALPVAAESPQAPAVSEPAGEVLDLDAIPVKPVTGPQSIKGIAIDDDDDMPGVGEEGDHDRHAEMGDDDEGPWGDDDD